MSSKNYIIFNVNDTRIVENIVFASTEDIEGRMNDILSCNNVKPLDIIYVEGEELTDEIVEEQHIKLKKDYYVGHGLYLQKEEYDAKMGEYRQIMYKQAIDPLIQALDNQYKLDDITEEEYKEELQKIKKKKQEIKDMFKKSKDIDAEKQAKNDEFENSKEYQKLLKQAKKQNPNGVGKDN